MRRPVRLCDDERGVTIVEFALILPVMLLVIMGLMDLSYSVYIRSVLESAMQKAGRDATLEGGAGQGATLDAQVMAMIQRVAPGAVADPPVRLSYSQFGHVAPENFTDSDNNDAYTPGECFDDVNNNGEWDANPGRTGQGGADDVVVYTMTIRYPRMFPLLGLMGWDAREAISATTIFRNQPYGLQNATVTNICGA